MTKQGFLKFWEFMASLGFLAGFFMSGKDLNIATIVLMVMLTLLMVFTVVLKEPIAKIQLWVWIIVMVLGTFGVALNDDAFIKWKPTIVNSGIGLAFLLSHVIGKLTLLERILGSHLKSAPAKKLRNLNFYFSVYSFLLAGLNVYIAFQFSSEVWVKFKIFGQFFINALFMGFGYFYLKEHVKEYFDEQQKQKL